MATLIEHNRQRIEWWLHAYPTRFPSGLQETLRIDGRRLAGRIILKKSSMERMDSGSVNESDNRLLKAFFSDLPRYDSVRYLALHFTALNPERGMEELERYEASGDDAAQAVARSARGGQEWVAQLVSGEGCKLVVPEVVRSCSKHEASVQHRSEVAEARHEYIRTIYHERLSRGDDKGAAGRFCTWYFGVHERTVRKAVRGK